MKIFIYVITICLFSFVGNAKSIEFLNSIEDTTKHSEETLTYTIDSSIVYANFIKAYIGKQKESASIALIIAGSGPTNADGNNPFFTSNTYKYLAEELGRNGISSVRYDKRGIGRSTKHAPKEKDLRFDIYVNDANFIVNDLHSRGYKNIIVIGHSEGSLIGMIVSAKNKYVSKFISIAGPGSAADLVLKSQFKEQGQELSKIVDPMIDSLKAGLYVSNIPPYLNSVFRKSVQGYMQSWFKYDPQAEIKKLSIPILILQGTNDLQVKVIDAQNLYLANMNSTLKIIEKMNHVLRIVESEEKSENLKAYNNPRLPLSEELLKNVVQFCK